MVMERKSERFRADLQALLPRLRRFGHALCGSQHEGDDLVQDSLEKALMREGQFEAGTRMDSWMFRIMQTTWIDKARARVRRNRIVEPMSDGIDVAGEDGSRTFAARIELDKVRKAMAALPDDERAVLALVSIEGMTYREAADALAIPIGTVMSRVARARSRLLELMEGRERPMENRSRP